MGKTYREQPGKYKTKKKKHYQSEKMSKKEYDALILEKLSREIFRL